MRTVSVTSHADLVAALGGARPGDHIVLEDGTYGGAALRLGSSGSASDPIVIRAKNKLRAKLTTALAVVASRVIIQGLDFEQAGVELSGDHLRVTRSRFHRRQNTMLRVIRAAAGTRIDHNEFFATKDVTSGDIKGIDLSVEQSAQAKNVEVDHNFFHDFPFKLDDYHTLSGAVIDIGLSPRSSAYRVNNYVHHNLFVDCGDMEATSIKSRGNRVEFNTIIGEACQIRVRQGGETTIIANWIEKGRGMPLGGDGNVAKWNRVVDSPQGITVWAGEEPAGNTTGSGIVQARNTLLVGNTARIIVGDFFSDRTGTQDILAENTVIHANKGDIVRRRHANTTVLDETSETPLVAVRLKVSEVGPDSP